MKTLKTPRAFFSGLPCVASRSPYELAAGSPPSLRDGDLLRPHRSPYCLRARSLGNLTEKCSSVPLSCSAPWVNALSNAALRARLPCIFQLPMMSLRVEPGIRGPNPATHPADLSAYVQGFQIFVRNIARYVLTIKTGGFKAREQWVQITHGLLHGVQVLINQPNRADEPCHLFSAPSIDHQFVARWHIDAIYNQKLNWRRGACEEHFVCARIARHLYNLLAGGATQNGIIHNQYITPFEFNPHCIEFLTDRFCPYGLTGHNERAAYITVLDKPFPVCKAKPVCHLHRSRAAGFRDRHDGVNLAGRQNAADFLRKIIPHPQPGLIDRNAIQTGIRPRQIDVFKQAGIQRRRGGALAALHMAVHVNKNRFAWRNVAHEFKTGALKRNRFGGRHPCGSLRGFKQTHTKRTDAIRIAHA